MLLMHRIVNCTNKYKQKRNTNKQKYKVQKYKTVASLAALDGNLLLLLYRTVKCTKPVPTLQWPAFVQLTAIARKDLPSAQNPLKECTKGEEEALN